MEWIEVTGTSLEETKEHALKMLGIEKEDAEFEISEEGKQGLFNRKITFRVRARIKPKTAAGRQQPKRGRRANNSSKENSRAKGAQRQRPQRAEKNQPTEKRRDRELMEKSKQEQILTDFFEGLLHAWGLKGSIKFNWPKDYVCDVIIEGEELGDLVGENAQILTAIETIARIPLKKQAIETRYAQFYVDIDGYRQKRTEALKEFALKLGKEVQESGKAKILEPMNNRDRKMVHDAISELDGVTTESEGEREDRRVKIFPS